MNKPKHGLGLNREEYILFLQDVYHMRPEDAEDYVNSRGIPPSVQQIRKAIADKKEK